MVFLVKPNGKKIYIYIYDLYINHISAYALTVEPKTELDYCNNNDDVDDRQSQEQFYILLDILEANKYENYELSNFALDKLYSVNNSAYWQGKKISRNRPFSTFIQWR